MSAHVNSIFFWEDSAEQGIQTRAAKTFAEFLEYQVRDNGTLVSCLTKKQRCGRLQVGGISYDGDISNT